RSKVESQNTSVIAGCEFIEGKIGKHDVILVKSGIGKVNAAIATTLLIQQYDPDVVLNTGSAGGFAESLEVGTIVISDEVRHHDVDATAFGYEIGQVPGMPPSYQSDSRLVQVAREAIEEIGEHSHSIGLIASGDVFMSDSERVNLV